MPLGEIKAAVEWLSKVKLLTQQLIVIQKYSRGPERERERDSLASSQGPTLIPSTANKSNHYTSTIFMAFEMQGCGHMTLILFNIFM